MEAPQGVTNRDLFIARGLALGESVSELARCLSVKPQTVRRRVAALYETTGVGSHGGLAGWAVARGVVSLGELQEVYGRAETGRERG